MNLSLYQPPDQGAVLASRSTFEVMPLAVQLAEQLAQTDFVPKGLRGNKPAIMAAILTGHEIGLPPMASLANIHVIEGKPGLSATGLRALILSHGHEIDVVENTNTRAVVYACRRGSTQGHNFVWTMDDAQRAGLQAKDNWRKYPKDMLVARATAAAARAKFADIIAGIPYVTEELEDGMELEEADRPAAGSDDGAIKRGRRARRPITEPPPTPPAPPPATTVDEDSPREEPAEVPPPPEPESAGEPAPGEAMSMAQEIAMICREIPLVRSTLIKAVTGKDSGRELTREEAGQVLEEARAIHRGQRQLSNQDGAWAVIDA